MVLAEVTTYLASQGIGTAATDLFYGPMKEAYPDAVVLVQEYGGLTDEPNLSDPTPTAAPAGKSIRLEFPRIQILCRGARNDYNTPRAKAEAARVALTKVLNQTLSGVRYLAIEPIQPPFPLSADENERERIVFNCQITKELS